MTDTTPDISNQDELSVAVRFINTKTCIPEERLVKVAETKDKTGAGQATDILDWLKSSGIPLSTVQLQTYDSTASMSGCNKGAQQKVSEALGRRIPYTKCLPHGTNLVIEHACEASPLISKIFDCVQQLYTFFSKSTKRHSQLKEAMQEVENALKLRNLSQTRWSARPESIEAVWRSLDAIIQVLHFNEEEGDSEANIKATGLINAVVNIDLVCGIMLLKNIMYYVA